jgi:hypothetical protein
MVLLIWAIATLKFWPLGIQKTFLCETIKNKFYSGLMVAKILKEIAVLLE